MIRWSWLYDDDNHEICDKDDNCKDDGDDGIDDMTMIGWWW